MTNRAKKVIEQLIQLADIKIDGSRPWDIKVHDERFYSRILNNSAMSLGESYMDGWWDAPQVDEVIHQLMCAKLNKKIKNDFKLLTTILKAKTLNLQSKKRATEVCDKHYDIGNDLFKLMLDKDMSYTCGYWKNADTLEEAQNAKLELTCQKLKLKPGMTLLDIGCGWGAFAKYAAKNFGVQVTGITISKEQLSLAQEYCKDLPIEIRFQDYRNVTEQFDRIVSLGMFEHVGVKNYRTYMKGAHRCLKDQGLFLLHTIGSNKSGINSNAWINKYIFPNAHIPSVKHIAKSIEKLFLMEDWHNFGPYYDKTLMAWHKNFEKHWEQLKPKYDERFRRMWNFYLQSCAGAFRAREIQLWQIVLVKGNAPTVYESIR